MVSEECGGIVLSLLGRTMQYLVHLFAMCCEEDANTCVYVASGIIGQMFSCMAMSGSACQDTKTIYVISVFFCEIRGSTIGHGHG